MLTVHLVMLTVHFSENAPNKSKSCRPSCLLKARILEMLTVHFEMPAGGAHFEMHTKHFEMHVCAKHIYGPLSKRPRFLMCFLVCI